MYKFRNLPTADLGGVLNLVLCCGSQERDLSLELTALFSMDKPLLVGRRKSKSGVACFTTRFAMFLTLRSFSVQD